MVRRIAVAFTGRTQDLTLRGANRRDDRYGRVGGSWVTRTITYGAGECQAGIDVRARRVPTSVLPSVATPSGISLARDWLHVFRSAWTPAHDAYVLILVFQLALCRRNVRLPATDAAPVQIVSSAHAAGQAADSVAHARVLLEHVPCAARHSTAARGVKVRRMHSSADRDTAAHALQVNGSGVDRYSTSRSLDIGGNAPAPLGLHKAGSSRSATKSPSKNKMASPAHSNAQASVEFNDLPHFDVRSRSR
jgi:hypothetical protein